MKKIEVGDETVKQMIHDYTVNIIGTPTLAEKYKLPKKRVIQILKDNGVKMDQPGRRNLGGRTASFKRNYYKHKDKNSAYHKEWREENKIHRKEYEATWREENREHDRERRRNYERQRKASDPMYKLVSNFRTAIYTVLKEQDIEKRDHYFKLLGYTQQDLANHLESLFTEGMTWENYGEWHVDHIIPLKRFTFTSTSDLQFRECWSLTNLQPLWGPENISKGCK